MPSWSPDGRYRVALGQKPSRLMLYSTNTKTWKALKQFQDADGFFTWSRDSKSLYMGMDQGNNGLYRLTVPEGRLERVSDPPGTYTGMRGGPAELNLTAEGQPAMMVTTGVAQIYSLQWKH